jgi:hypothetical protein
MNPTPLELTATIMFACAVIHTFLVKRFQHIAHQYPKGSIGENFFHFLGEVEVVLESGRPVFFVFLVSWEVLEL